MGNRNSYNQYYWDKEPPAAKVQGGTTGPADINGPGKPLYVCRAQVPNAGIHLGKTWDDYDACNIAWGGQEFVSKDFEYLGIQNWTSYPPIHKFQAGTTDKNDSIGQGKPLYVCKGPIHNAGVHPGKTWDGYNMCNIPWGGKEHSVKQFEYLH